MDMDTDVIAEVIAEIRRVEAIRDRALTDEEVRTLKAGAFFRRVAPDWFDDEESDASANRAPR